MGNPFQDIQKRLAKEKSLLFIDIETKPMLVWAWGLGKQYLTHKQIAEDSKVITVQWMFEGDKHVSYLTWDQNQDDRKMLETFAKVYNSAKAVVSQNGKSFDIKVLNWRMNALKLPPLNKTVLIDTLQLSRQVFRPASHKLDYRSKCYGLGGKERMEFQDWVDVVQRKPGALLKMVRYGIKDVPDLRYIFWRELPYYTKLPIPLARLVYPNEGKLGDFCPVCAKKRQKRYNLVKEKKLKQNKEFLRCLNCNYSWEK